MRSPFPFFVGALFVGASLAPGCRCSDDPPASADTPAPAKSTLAARAPLGRRLPKLVAVPPRILPHASASASAAPPPPEAPDPGR